jgi:hypothetical protein
MGDDGSGADDTYLANPETFHDCAAKVDPNIIFNHD